MSTDRPASSAPAEPEESRSLADESHIVVSEHDGATRVDIADDSGVRPGPGPGQPEADAD
ncbi:hypothetical protein N3K63_14000 [Microbacterium sp. W1N]|uniref:hypothetical protein n=1 Tax=Microbacterium festucae TaxID=2977531 RepID=UPI0021BE01DD|nr:hypothetical protein [Microbacterium festucae]MCT9821393.1 hypothetical protein [Microbacterium festucae]